MPKPPVVTPKTEQRRKKEMDDARFSFKVNGDTYTVSPADLTGLQEAKIRATTGHAVPYLIQTVTTDPGLDIIGALMWISLMQQGLSDDYEKVLESISYASEIEVVDGQEHDDAPEA